MMRWDSFQSEQACHRRHDTPASHVLGIEWQCGSTIASWGVFAQTETCDESQIVRLA